MFTFADEILDALKSGTLSRKTAAVTEDEEQTATSNGGAASPAKSNGGDVSAVDGGKSPSNNGSNNANATVLSVEHGVIVNAKTEQHAEHVIVEKEKGKGCCAIS